MNKKIRLPKKIENICYWYLHISYSDHSLNEEPYKNPFKNPETQTLLMKAQTLRLKNLSLVKNPFERRVLLWDMTVL